MSTYLIVRSLGGSLIGIDDANIFFVYARNFAGGHGIVYNIGGEHVEGFSSVLYFLICSLGYAFSATPETGFLVLNFFFALLTILLMLYMLQVLCSRLLLSASLRVILMLGFLILIFANPFYIFWTIVSLMDSGLYSMLVTIAFVFLALLILTPNVSQTKSIQLSFLIPLLVLSRPEGVLWAVLSLVVFFYLNSVQGKSYLSSLRASL